MGGAASECGPTGEQVHRCGEEISRESVGEGCRDGLARELKCGHLVQREGTESAGEGLM